MGENNTDRRIRKTKKAIHEAILSLLEEKEYNDITISELTERADVNRKTFYNHYSDIQSVIEEIEDDWVDSLVQVLRTSLEPFSKENHISVREIKEHLNDISLPFFTTLLEELNTHPAIYLILTNQVGHSSLIRKMVNAEKNLLLETLGQNLSNSVWLDYFLVFTVNGAAGMLEQWYHSDKTISADQLSRFFKLMFMSDSAFEYMEKNS